MYSVESAVTALSEYLEERPADPFPWRKRREPFLILISELMLMRTRADLVVNVFNDFIERYPSPEALLEAEASEVEAVLRPLGLVKRIPFFIKAAVYICENYPDGIPADRKSLKKIPGVGRYTADAVLAFAFNESIVPADVNVLRWLSRITGLQMTHQTKGSPELRALLPTLAPLGGRTAYKLIDFIRDICRPRKPRCEVCPIVSHCHHGMTLREMNAT